MPVHEDMAKQKTRASEKYSDLKTLLSRILQVEQFCNINFEKDYVPKKGPDGEPPQNRFEIMEERIL